MSNNIEFLHLWFLLLISVYSVVETETITLTEEMNENHFFSQKLRDNIFSTRIYDSEAPSSTTEKLLKTGLKINSDFKPINHRDISIIGPIPHGFRGKLGWDATYDGIAFSELKLPVTRSFNMFQGRIGDMFSGMNPVHQVNENPHQEFSESRDPVGSLMKSKNVGNTVIHQHILQPEVRVKEENISEKDLNYKSALKSYFDVLQLYKNYISAHM